MQWYSWLLVAIGIGVVCDGVGSVLVRSGQYHNAWFDGERYVRAAAGVIVIILGVVIP